MLDILKGFNNQKGRFNRYKFWVHTLIMQLLLTLLVVILSVLGGDLNIEFLNQINSFAGVLGMIYLMFTSYIKRLHDLGKSGWMSLLIIVPLANIYIFVICGFFKGTKGKNDYGEDPLGNTEKKKVENNDSNIEL